MAKKLDTSEFGPEWKDLFKCLRDPDKTVGDVHKKIKEFSDRYALKNEDNKIKDGSIKNLDTIMYFLIGGDKSDKYKDYIAARFDRRKKRTPAALYSNINNCLGDKGEVDDLIKESPIEKESLIFDAFEKIKNILQGSSHKVEVKAFTDFIDNEFLNKSASTIKSTQEEIENMSVKNIVKDAIENSEKKQVIFTGAPGTGKTFSVEKYVKQATQQSDSNAHPNWEFVQFHSSYDYTDFVEGLRPVRKDGKMVFVRMDGIFKKFCRKVVQANNKIDKENEKNEREQNGEQGGEPVSQKEYENYYFIIDEINRADLGRVFGELMYCFEKRGAEHSVKTQYHNLPTYDLSTNDYLKNDVFENGFYIPENVIILGTMNDIDRSVETFDFALRRRFDWVEIKANDVMEDVLTAMGCDTDIVDDIKKMNNIIANQPGLGEAFAIGPAYFKGYKGNTPEERKNSLETICKKNIEPILREYMRGRQTEVIDKFVDKCRVALGLPPDKKNSGTGADSGEQS